MKYDLSSILLPFQRNLGLDLLPGLRGGWRLLFRLNVEAIDISDVRTGNQVAVGFDTLHSIRALFEPLICVA